MRYFLRFIAAVCWIASSTVLVWAQVLLPEEALIRAKQTPSVVAFYSLNDGQLSQCIQTEVLRPCDSDWVTCIEDAWVVRFFLKDSCAITPNERLSVTLLMHNQTGKIISHFPEVEYFTKQDFCIEDYDCFYDTQEKSAVNFIHLLAANQSLAQCQQCRCQQSQCRMD